uniref:Ubiquitin carboxyl-terminal hydrolase n=1 Tax=Pavo cristatus TaxID=9049 RepID=A0A8C9FX06_PAVCR
MRVKDPSRANPEKTKRSKRPNRPQDEDSSDDIAGLTCQHVSQAVDVHHVKRAVAQSIWSICSECLKERRMSDGEPVAPSDIWLCLKCGSQGCSKSSEGQHSLKHFQTARTEPHCIVISLSTWIIWCYECDEELSTHCNKKALAQIVDFLQKHGSRAEASSSKIIRLRDESSETSEILKGKSSGNGTSVPVKGINNLGNTCFFNAVMQNLAQTHILNELMYEMKEKGTKLKICHTSDSQLDPLVVNLSSPGPLTSAMFLFLHSMREAGRGPLSPKVLFSQLCQKAPRFKGFQQQDSQELLHYLLDAMRIEETKVTISTVKEPFIDLSLPIIEERKLKKKTAKFCVIVLTSQILLIFINTEKKMEGVYTNARKQLLISSVPAILILHLKRFHQAGLSLRKVNRHVDFPLILDLAPFCSASCKNVTDGARVLYSLYGIVEHSGSMRGGHYAAYVKVRAPSKKLLEHISSTKNVLGLKEAMGASAGQWVYVSDAHVQMVPESRVLNAQAYLLFYERLMI